MAEDLEELWNVLENSGSDSDNDSARHEGDQSEISGSASVESADNPQDGPSSVEEPNLADEALEFDSEAELENYESAPYTNEEASDHYETGARTGARQDAAALAFENHDGPTSSRSQSQPVIDLGAGESLREAAKVQAVTEQAPPRKGRGFLAGLLVGLFPLVLIGALAIGFFLGRNAEDTDEGETNAASSTTVEVASQSAELSSAAGSESTPEPAGPALAKASEQAATDPVLLIVSEGKLIVRGVVPPQIEDRYLEGIRNSPSGQQLEVVNELTIDENAPAPTRTELQYEDVILFGSGQIEPEAGFGDTFEGLVQYLLVTESASLVVKAYSDVTGTAESNLELSTARGESVKAFMMGRGIAEERIIVDALGEEGASGNTGEDAALDRRVEFEVKHQAGEIN